MGQRRGTSVYFLWFIIFGLGAMLYILSLIGDMLTQRFEQRLLERKKARSAKAKRRQLLQELEMQEAIFAPPDALLQHAQEFALATGELVERAQSSMATVKQHTHLFSSTELQRYQKAYAGLLKAEDKRRQAFEQAWIRAMQRARAGKGQKADEEPPPPQPQPPHYSPMSASHEDFDWSQKHHHAVLGSGDDLTLPYYADELIPCTCSQHQPPFTPSVAHRHVAVAAAAHRRKHPVSYTHLTLPTKRIV